jgi:hypothetical protein
VKKKEEKRHKAGRLGSQEAIMPVGNPSFKPPSLPASQL